MKPFGPFLFFPLVFFLACAGEEVPSVAREDLFSLEIGRLEDQIDLFNLEGRGNTAKTALAMRDGLFYISNGSGQKIVRYTSYGDLLFMIYNKETNPQPLTLSNDIKDDRVVTRWASTYPLLSPGVITIDSRKHIYAGDRLPYERYGYDGENKALLDGLVLHFDEAGRFVEYLGQEGIGGTPFPLINGLYASVQDEIAVVCRLPSGWNIYWFDGSGMLLYVIPIRNDTIPVPPDRADALPALETIIAAPDKRQLFIKVDYYRPVFDESTNTGSGMEPDSSVIWVMDVESGSYVDTAEVPFFEVSAGQNRRESEKMFYSMMGVIRGGWVFLSFPVNEGYSLLILGSSGVSGRDEQRRGFIRVDNEELQFNAFNVSEDGIVSALLASNWEAKLVWWRTDRIAGEVTP
ncbi:MAG: hypothetical protein LBT16_09190 [Treponema sp.]|jgi:hypothetical protein|nr:hypothetical protein [Treponema sp.]